MREITMAPPPSCSHDFLVCWKAKQLATHWEDGNHDMILAEFLATPTWTGSPDAKGFDSEGVSVMGWAICLRDIELAREALTICGVNEPARSDGIRPLSLALGLSPPIATFLIEKGANFRHRDPATRSTLLHRACCHPGNDLAPFLDAGLRPDARDKEGNTPLITAAMMAPVHIPALLAAGANPLLANKRSEDALSVLFLSCYRHAREDKAAWDAALSSIIIAGAATGREAWLQEVARNEGVVQQVEDCLLARTAQIRREAMEAAVSVLPETYALARPRL